MDFEAVVYRVISKLRRCIKHDITLVSIVVRGHASKCYFRYSYWIGILYEKILLPRFIVSVLHMLSKGTLPEVISCEPINRVLSDLVVDWQLE